MSSGVSHPEKEAVQEMLLYLLLDGSKVTGVSGWMLCFRTLWVLHRSLTLLKSLMLDRWSLMMLWAIISVYKCLCSVCSIQRRQQGHRDQPLPAGHHVRQRCRLSVLGETAGQRMQVRHAVFWILVPLSVRLSLIIRHCFYPCICGFGDVLHAGSCVRKFYHSFD